MIHVQEGEIYAMPLMTLIELDYAEQTCGNG